MTWLKVDDKLTSHPKWLTLTLEAKSLWLHAAVWCASHNNDGALPEHVMPLIAFSSSVPPRQASSACDLLVKARLWRRLPKAKGGGWEINDWLAYQPSRQQVQDRAAADEVTAERKRLHTWLHGRAVGKRVKAAITARDGVWCRYCGQRCREDSDHRGPTSRTFDLVDPSSTWDREAKALPSEEIDRIADLWVVACGWCNAIKQSRTPDEAGMTLLAAPRSRENGTQRDPHATGSSPGCDSGPDRDGPGRIGAVTPPRGAVPDGGPFDDLPDPDPDPDAGPGRERNAA